MTASQIGKSAVIHPVVVVTVNGYKFRALLDSGASHSYVSSRFVGLVNVQPRSSSLRQIAMLMGVTTKKMKTYDVVVQSVSSDFRCGCECDRDRQARATYSGQSSLQASNQRSFPPERRAHV